MPTDRRSPLWQGTGSGCVLLPVFPTLTGTNNALLRRFIVCQYVVAVDRPLSPSCPFFSFASAPAPLFTVAVSRPSIPRDGCPPAPQPLNLGSRSLLPACLVWSSRNVAQVQSASPHDFSSPTFFCFSFFFLLLFCLLCPLGCLVSRHPNHRVVLFSPFLFLFLSSFDPIGLVSFLVPSLCSASSFSTFCPPTAGVLLFRHLATVASPISLVPLQSPTVFLFQHPHGRETQQRPPLPDLSLFPLACCLTFISTWTTPT